MQEQTSVSRYRVTAIWSQVDYSHGPMAISEMSFQFAASLKSLFSLIALLSASTLTYADEAQEVHQSGSANDAFLNSLASKDERQASQAILLARSHGTPSTTVAWRLVEIVDSDRSDYLRSIAAAAVGELCPVSDSAAVAKSAVQWLRSDRSPWVREGAAISLGRLKQDYDELVSTLIEGTKDVDPNVRFASYISLGTKRQRAGMILETLQEGILDRSRARYAISQSFFAQRAVAIGAITSLGLCGKSAESSLPQLLLLLRDEDQEIGVAACTAAARISDDSSVHLRIETALVPFLEVKEDSPFEVNTCYEALKCLAILKAPARSSTRTTSVEKVLRLLQNHELQIYNPDFTIAIAGAIKHFGGSAETCLPSLRSVRVETDSAEAAKAIQDAIDTIEKSVAEARIPADH